MLAFASNAKIFLCNEAVDLRKGFEGLSVLVEMLFQAPLTSGAYFIFLNRSRDRMKVLYWDIDGLAIWYKRLGRGRFAKRREQAPLMERREFLMMLEGVVPKCMHKRFTMA